MKGSGEGGIKTARVGIGYDSHSWCAGRPLVLGGVEIEHSRGLSGHSDADALIHAICDAVLGAVGAGDIGVHFPDNDPAYRGISSLVLLARVREIAAARGYRVVNVDATVIMERPKLRAYVGGMIANIADALAMDAAAVSVKGKTNEGMGFVGREEGVAVMAVALAAPVGTS
ncbi:MAG: 2-C-methyl-D-erythritol 2,4-cyclodiphosphate synthase [Pseudomonadota bacterium]|nr:2-C-methyl-D-erythritol 2,4-cyclodiphosphate synthase [Pseudomonadota bacterium]